MSELPARDAFRNLRLQRDAHWAALVRVDRDRTRPLSWFGSPPEGRWPVSPAMNSRRRPLARWAVGAMALAMAAAVSALAGGSERAGAAVAPHIVRTGLVTVTTDQRAEATAVNNGDACYWTEVALIDGTGHAVASESARVCPGDHLVATHSPNWNVRLRSVVAMHTAQSSVVEPCSHTLEVVDVDTGRSSVVISRP